MYGDGIGLRNVGVLEASNPTVCLRGFYQIESLL
jgi:hypothetical protein